MTMSTLSRITVLAGAIALACSAWAQQPTDQQYQSDQYQDTSAPASSNQVDPPTRVARLGYLSGDVSFAPAGESEWSRAQRNRPMVTGDKLFTNSGRAELQIGASIIHVDQGTSVDVLSLNDQIAQLQLTQGTLNLDVRRLRGGEVFEVDTPTIAFIADRVGNYRIDVDAQGKVTHVSVRRGSGEAVGEGGKRVRIEEGHSLAFNDPQLSDYQTGDLRQPDSFDNFATQRDERYERSPSRNYVAEDVPGYADLDDNGSWEDAPEYGHVWYPTHVAADWAPYHDGSWNWVEPYGWNYVDDSSWGFAPYHYGRWAYVGSRWGWVPGPVDVAPVYAPALVAFVGGGGFGIDISLGGPIGWFPLGPGEVYFPGYPCGRGYFNNVNISNTVVNNSVVNNYYGAFSSGRVNYAQMNYANRTAPRAMTAMSATAFASGRPVASSAIAVNRTTLANARVLPRATVAPTRASLVASRGRAMAPPATVTNRNVVAVNRPAATPASFAQRQTLLRQNPGRPLSSTQMRGVATRSNAAAMRSNVRVAGAAGVATPAVNARTNARATAATTTTLRGNASTHVRSSEFAHQGQTKTTSAPPRESATARAHASANARFERGAKPPPPRESATAKANASTNARFERGSSNPVRSSTFAAQNHANVQEARSRGTTARVSTPSAQHAQAQNQNRAPLQHTQPQREVSQHRAPQSATRVTEKQHAQAQYRAPQSTARVTAQQHAQAQYRAPQSTARVTEQQHAQAQYRAPQSTARATEQPHAQAQYRAPQSTARVTEQPHAQAQYRAPQQPAARVSEQPHAQAQAQRATTQPAPQRHAKNRDEKQSGGGG
jgi:hypothetical protein